MRRMWPWPLEGMGLDRRTVRVGPDLRSWIFRAGVVSLFAWIGLQKVSPPDHIPWSPAMREASAGMVRGLEATRAFCQENGISMDPAQDPNRTCLIGPRYTPLFTSLGQLEAKRTSVQPDVAGLLTYFLQEVGVSAGDTVAVGASGSFPGLLLATLSAVKVLDAHPVTILSLGASSYGATRVDLHLMDLYRLFRSAGLVEPPPAAVSFGGDGDVGREFEAGLRERLREEILSDGIPLLVPEDLESNVSRRLGIYGSPKAFVNIGGGEANLGTDALVLSLAAGPIDPGGVASFPPPSRRGVLFAMMAAGVPAIHLLNLRGLALAYGLPWDPRDLALPGSTELVDPGARPNGRFWSLTLVYLALLGTLAVPLIGRTQRN